MLWTFSTEEMATMLGHHGPKFVHEEPANLQVHVGLQLVCERLKAIPYDMLPSAL